MKFAIVANTERKEAVLLAKELTGWLDSKRVSYVLESLRPKNSASAPRQKSMTSTESATSSFRLAVTEPCC